ncbi:MAG: hypothetical protein U0Z17_00415 [Bacteroidales bacterium]
MQKFFITGYISFLIICITGCASSQKFVSGTYISKCQLYGRPECVITIKNDSTYTRIYPYMIGFSVEGKWSVKSDTLTLHDKYEIIGENKEMISGERLYNLTPKFLFKRGSLIEINLLKEKKNWCKLERHKI